MMTLSAMRAGILASTCLVFAALTGCVSLAGDTENVASGQTVEWRSLFDGQALGDWRSTDFLFEGPVTIEEGQIVLGRGDGLTGVTWSGEDSLPSVNYEIELEARRLSGMDFFCGLTFPVQESHISLIVGGWGGTLVGLSSVDGFDASENETTIFMDFDTGRWYTIRVRVADDRIRAWIDGEVVVDLEIKDRRLGIRPEVAASRPLGIASWNTSAALRNIRLRTLD